MLQAKQGQELDNMLNAWGAERYWTPTQDRERIHAAAVAGTLPTTTMDEILRCRLEQRQECSAR